MNAWRLPLILCLSVVFAAPVLGDMMRSSEDLLVAGLKYVAALCLAWGGVNGISRVVDGFDHANRLAAREREVAAAAEAEAAQRTVPGDVDPAAG